ncbi:MAG TPA: thiamine ABC transporter substrate-binding protein [Herpetosiphonaceae bacterium]
MQGRTRWINALALGLLLLLAACGEQTPTSAPAAATATTSAAPTDQAAGQATPAAATATTASGAASQPFAGQTLTLVTHDSFAIGGEVISGFEELTGAKVQILQAGDAGEALNKSILAKGAPLGDVFFGVDNTFLSRALGEGIFEAYAPQGLDQIPAELKLDPENRLIPIDYGYVNLNYDKAALAKAGLQPPADLRDLAKPEWKGKLVVENPAKSSPGLAFLLATIDHFGESGDYTWKQFWADLKANEVKVADGWSDAYYNDFAGGGASGAYPLVVSYATSPAAAVIFSDPRLSDAPTGNILVPGGVFRQIEFAGILQGTKNPELAKAWMDYMLGERFQGDIGGQMLVYPALPKAQVPPEFASFAQVPEQYAKLTPEQIASGRDAWLEQWADVMAQ